METACRGSLVPRLFSGPAAGAGRRSTERLGGEVVVGSVDRVLTLGDVSNKQAALQALASLRV